MEALNTAVLQKMNTIILFNGRINRSDARAIRFRKIQNAASAAVVKIESVDTQISLPGANAGLTRPADQWLAIQTRSRHEKKVADELQRRGVQVFLPTIKQKRKWSDRVKIVDFPLFSGYVFVCIPADPRARFRVLSTHGVVRFVGPTSNGTPIPAVEIENLRTALLHDIPLRPMPFIKIGQRVRIRSGVLAGLEGILTGTRGKHQLVVSISSIQKSVSLAIEGYDVEPI
jgi:transcriptional antiterminator NusG